MHSKNKKNAQNDDQKERKNSYHDDGTHAYIARFLTIRFLVRVTFLKKPSLLTWEPLLAIFIFHYLYLDFCLKISCKQKM